MNGHFDLQIDTEGVRLAAGTLEQAGRGFVSSAGRSGAPAVDSDPLGGSAEAVSTVAIVNLRIGQAHDAAVALCAVAAGLSNGLRRSADQFDRYEAAIRLGAG